MKAPPWLKTASRPTSESPLFLLIIWTVNKIVFIICRATILQHETSKMGKANTESLAKPAIMRAGADGELKLLSFQSAINYVTNYVI